MQDAIRQSKILSIFLMKRKESCARRGGGAKEGEVAVLDLFQRYYKLSECSCYMYETYPLEQNLFLW